MTRYLNAAFSLLLGAASLAAQTQPEGIQIYPGLATDGSSFITRLGFNGGAGEALAEYPKSHFEGIGDMSLAGGANNPKCALAQVVLFFQDQNRLTAHTFGITMRPPASSGNAPDTNNTNAIILFTNIPSPTTTTGTGPVGWWMSLQFVNNGVPTPIATPCKSTVYFGMSFVANTAWPATDGLSAYTAYYDPIGANVPSGKGDNVAPRKNVPNLAWEVSGTPLAAKQPQVPQVLDYILGSPYSSIQVGARHKPGQSKHSTNDGFGVAGLYPSISGGLNGRQDGAIVRITDNRFASIGGQYGLYMSLSTGTSLKIPPLQLMGINGSIYLGPVGQFFLLSGNLSTAGAHTTFLLAPPGSIPTYAATACIKVYFQAWTKGTNATAVDITNLAGVFY
jgi:hypothetical protein